MYKVTYSIDYLDPNPEVHHFETTSEAQDWIHEAVDQRMGYIVQHSPYSLTEEEVESIREVETSLVTFQKCTCGGDCS